jgi:hypothetical protein
MKSKLVKTAFGKRRVIDGWNGIKRLWVKRTNLKTYAVSTSERLTFDSMVAIGPEYHFATLAELHHALDMVTAGAQSKTVRVWEG